MKMCYVLGSLSLFLVIQLAQGVGPKCFDIAGIENEVCYRYLKSKYRFNIARNACLSIGSGWGLLDSQITDTHVIRKILGSTRIRGTWLDVTKQIYPNWTTVDGHTLNDTFVAIESGDNLGCAGISVHEQGTLWAMKCNPERNGIGYICEFKEKCPLQGKCSLKISRNYFLLDHDYKSLVPSWTSARQLCVAMGGDLAVIKTANGVNRIIEHIENHEEKYINGKGSGWFYTGVHKEKWIQNGNEEGIPNGKWAKGHPKLGNCVIQTRFGWESSLCEESRPFVCQRFSRSQLKQDSTYELRLLVRVAIASLVLLCVLLILAILGVVYWICQKLRNSSTGHQNNEDPHTEAKLLQKSEQQTDSDSQEFTSCKI